MNKARVNELVDWIQQGRIMDAMREFYADDVSMQDNSNPPTLGLTSNLEREQAFVESVAEIHENRAAEMVIDGDHAVIHWLLEFTNIQGQRLRLDQLALQKWKGDKIVSERFVYDSAAVIQSH